jgi:hypothetical protein
MKIELDLPDELVASLRARSQERGISLHDYTQECILEILNHDSQTEIDRRIAEGLEDIENGRSYGPFSTHRELMDCLESRTKTAKRGKRRPG